MTNLCLLVGMDGSAGGRAALSHALQQAGASASRLHLVCIVPLRVRDLTQDVGEEQALGVVDAARRSMRLNVLEPALAECAKAGVVADGEVCAGNPAERLAAIAVQRGVSAIVVGRRGQSRLKALVFGSTASNLVQLSSLPVTVVPSD